MYNIKFSPLTHDYFDENDNVVPSVSQIIQFVSPMYDGPCVEILERIEKQAALGTEVHKLLELYDVGDQKYESYLNDEKYGYLLQWEIFMRDHNIEIIPDYIERIVYHPRLKYAGTVDRVVSINNKNYVLDIKTGKKKKHHGLQTAGYAMALSDQCVDNHILIHGRLAVYLQPDGYEIARHNDTDYEAFSGLVHFYHWSKSRVNTKVKEII